MAKHPRRVFLIILDGVGFGPAPDSPEYGDTGANTLAHVAEHSGGLRVSALRELGLANIAPLPGVDPVDNPAAAHGLMREKSAGKDSITGHWELCGVENDVPFPTYPNGFPGEIIDLVREISGRDVIGNEVASGTEIMERLGGEHVRTGALILYTSADSVLQLLAHKEIVPLEELYRVCGEIHAALEPPHRVGRVIARPFTTEDGTFVRTPNRRDFAVEPIAPTVLDVLLEQDLPVHGIGKVDTLFAGRGFSSAEKTKLNADGIEKILERIQSDARGLTFANLIDFDMLWGHRRDPQGFAAGLEEMDAGLVQWREALRPDDLMIITADHGNDPVHSGSDHTREQVPVLAWIGKGGNGKALGTRDGFADVAATVAEYLQVAWNGPGRSFLDVLQTNKS